MTAYSFNRLIALVQKHPHSELAAKPVAVVYTGTAGDGTCAAHNLEAFGYEVVFFPGKDGNGNELMLSKLLSTATLYVQPGGGGGSGPEVNYTVNRNAVKDYDSDIRNFVQNGGRYIGICAGAFLADDNPPEYPGFGLLGSYVYTMDYITQPNAEVRDQKEHIITVNWGSSGQAPRKVVFQNGPSFALQPACKAVPTCAAAVKPIGFYRNGVGGSKGDMASLVLPYGKGSVVLLGPHPEEAYNQEEGGHLSLYCEKNSPTADMFKDVVQAKL